MWKVFQNNNWKYFLCISFLLIAVFSCDDTFEPLSENDRYFFTMAGYLDASADTQWVRVMPIRKGLDHLPSLENVSVEIEHAESGVREQMHDSLFYFGYGAEAWNFWSTMDIEPEETYRIIAEDAEGNISSVSISIPDDFPVPMITTIVESNPFETERFSVSISGVGSIADIRSIYVIEEVHSQNQNVFRYAHKDKAESTGEDTYSALIPQFEDVQKIAKFYHPELEQALQYFSIIHRQIFVASAGDDWFDFSVLDEFELMLPDGMNNVDFGLGYVIGIVSKTIPVKNCYDENGNTEPCPVEKPRR